MKIAVIRGPMLNKYEMQSYEPLTKYFDIIAFYSGNPETIHLINLKKKKLKTLEELLSFNLFNRFVDLPFRVMGYKYHMIGLEKELAKFDIINTVETYHAFSYQAVKAKMKYGCKLVVTCWENIPFFVENTWLFQHNLRHKIKEIVRKSADLFIAITQRAKEALIFEGVPKEKITVIPAGVDINVFKPRKKKKEYLTKLGISQDDFVILTVCRFVWEKGIFDIIYAAKKLITDNDLKDVKIKIILIGKGPEERTMRWLINRLGVNEIVNIAGVYQYDKMPLIYNLADIFLLPSIPKKNWQEQFGMVLVEAMASGLPIITTYCGSIPEVIGNAGVIVQPNDPLSIYQAIKEIILNEDIRINYGRLARERAENVFDSEKVALRIKEEFEKLVRK
ncbi:glycosyltransferase family 4 protein [Archaeoglobus sp.]